MEIVLLIPMMHSPSLYMAPILALLAVSAGAAGIIEHPADPSGDLAIVSAPEPLIEVWTPEVEARMLEPIPEIETGIGPGSALRISHRGDSDSFLCTANFVWTDDFDRLYLGTAGHCVLPAGKTATHGPDKDHDRNDTKVEVRTGPCPISGLGAACGVGGASAPWVPLGEVTYGVYTRIGEDFALVEIPQQLHDEVRYEMPVWGEASEEGTLRAQETTLLYGHGVGYGEAFVTRGRAGIQQGLLGFGDGDYWSAIGPAHPGDSGGGVASGGVGGVEAEKAIGILTHGAIVPEVGAPLPVYVGTHIDQAKLLVAEDTGLRVWTLPGGAPLPDLEVPEQEEGENKTLETGTAVVRHENEQATTKNHTYRWDNSWGDVRIMVNLEIEQGKSSLTITDGAGETVLTFTTDESRTVDEVIRGVSQGPWTIEVDYEDHLGSLALRIEQADDEQASGDGGTGEGGTGDADGPDRKRAKSLPAPGAIALLVLCGLALLVRARRQDPGS